MNSENFFTLTFANDPLIIQKAISIQDRLIEELKRSVKSVNWSIISLFQPLPGLFAEIGKQKGGNVLGLDGDNNYIRMPLPSLLVFFSYKCADANRVME
jgi:hypothetical protein